MTDRRRVLLFVAVALAFRLAVIATWRAPAGDGVQYYQLAE
jgi:hypothetical protein